MPQLMSDNSQLPTSGNNVLDKIIINKNPVTNLTDEQVNALSAVIQASHKNDAKEFVASHGVDNAAALIALHNLTSPTASNDSGNSQSSSSAQPQSQAQPQQQQQAQNFNPLALLHNLVQGVVDIIPTSPEAKIANSTVALNRIKMAAGLPAEVALPAAEAATKQAELAAGAPQANVDLTKQQTEQSRQDILNRQAEIKSSIYKTQSERDIQNIQRLTDRRKQVLEQMNEDLQHGPIINRGKRLDNYRKQLDYYDIQLQKAGGSIAQPSSGNYLKTGTLPDGRKVGVKSDGTTEIING